MAITPSAVGNAPSNPLSQIPGNGVVTKLSDGSFTVRELVAGSTKVTISNPAGQAGGPTIDVNQSNMSLGSIGGTLNLASQVTGSLPTSSLSGTINLGSQISATLGVANGGTGVTSIDALIAAMGYTYVPKPYNVTGINCKVAAQTTIVPAITGKKFLLYGQPIITLSAGSGITITPTIRIGNNGSFNNVVSATLLSGLATVGNVGPSLSLATGAIIDIGTNPIKLDVSIAATATTYAVDVLLFGIII